MKITTQQKIIKEILEAQKKNPNVIAVNIMGSVSRGEEKSHSDIDIEIVTDNKERKFEWKKEEKEGIHIDFIISSKGQILYQIKNHPYFCHMHADKKILYDPTGFMTKIKGKNQSYINQHPEVNKFWHEKFSKMKEAKAKGEEKESLREIFDEAEIKFSKEHKVTRDFFKK